MAMTRGEPTNESERFRRGMNDLTGVVESAAVQSGRAPSEIVSVLLDSLLRMFPQDHPHASVESATSTAAATAGTVFVVDDDVVVREALQLLIAYTGCRVETFGSAHEFLARLPVAGATCLVLDVSLADLSGLELQRYLGLGRMHIPVIFITGHADTPMAVQAMKEGAVAFLTKPLGSRQLVTAIRDALCRSHAGIARDAAVRAVRAAYQSLSRREREVMARVVAGRLNKHIAADLGISEITVKAHRGRVMRKMKAGSLADLVTMDSRLRVSEPASA